MPTRLDNPGPIGPPVQNQGGPVAPKPGQPKQPTPQIQPSAKPRAVAPVVPDQPIPRTRMDSVQRPVTSSPSTTPGIPPPTAVPPPPPGKAAPGPTASPGQPPPDQGLQPEAGANQTMQDQAAAAAGQMAPATPQQVAEQSKQLEDQRKAQPSHIPGVPVGTYENVARAKPPGNMNVSPMKAKAWNDNRDQQLRDFGDYPMKGDPNMPAPPIRPFGRSFNPFSGKFTGEKGPNAFTMMGIDFEKFKGEFFNGD